MELANHTRIRIYGRPGAMAACQKITCSNSGLNARPMIQVEGISTRPLNPRHYQHAIIKMDYHGSEHTYHGELLSCLSEIQTPNAVRFCLQFGASLHRLDQASGHRLYINQSVEEIITCLLSSHAIKAVFHWQGPSRKLPYTAQGGVNDYDFFLRLCVEHGIIFYYRFESRQAVLHVTDGLPSGSSSQHALHFNPANALVSKHGVFTALRYYTANLPDQVRIRGADEMNPNVMFEAEGQNQTDLPGNGLLNLSHQYPFKNQSDCERQARCLQQQLDWQREWLVIETQAPQIQPGDRVCLQGHPQSRANRTYRVLNVHTSSADTDAKAAHPFRSEITLISADTPYRMPSTFTRLAWDDAFYGPAPTAWQSVMNLPEPSLQIAEIQGEQGKALMDEQGRYHVQPLFDAKNKVPGKNSHPVRQLQLAAGPMGRKSQGVHMPLPEKTRVVLGYLHRQIDQPVILGVLPDPLQPLPVSENNRSELIIRHRNGTALVMNDTETQQSIQLYTEQDAHGLSFQKHATQEQVTGKSSGAMSFKSHQDMVLSSGQNFQVKSKQYHCVAGEAFTMGVKQNMVWQADKAIYCSAGNDWLLKSLEGDFNLSSQTQLNMEAKQCLYQANSFNISSGFCEVTAANAWIVDSAQGATLSAGPSECALTQSSIRFKSPKISIIAQQIVQGSG